MSSCSKSFRFNFVGGNATALSPVSAWSFLRFAFAIPNAPLAAL